MKEPQPDDGEAGVTYNFQVSDDEYVDSGKWQYLENFPIHFF